jgi:integrase
MLIQISSHGPTLVDDCQIPRYWAAVWAMFHGTDLAPSTLKRKLSHIEELYKHTESLGGNLDDALSELDLGRLGNSLEAFFVMLRNVPRPTQTTAKRWATAFHFVRDTCMRLEKNPAMGKKMAAVQEHISRLDNLYLGLRPYRLRHGRKSRAIPRAVVAELLQVVQPGTPKNPFIEPETQWRVYALVGLLLLQGLRLGEALSLPADFLKSERDPRTGHLKWRLSVQTNESEGDPRAEPPALKNEHSIRTIPVAAATAEGLLAYLENYRGRVEHGFFLISNRKRPLSLSGASKALERLTEALSPQAKAELLELTGAQYIRAHALRHTCAVVRMKQLLAMGNIEENAMTHLRSFFGWTKTSVMPLHYAKMALDERLNEIWNDKLDDRIEILRSLPI